VKASDPQNQPQLHIVEAGPFATDNNVETGPGTSRNKVRSPLHFPRRLLVQKHGGRSFEELKSTRAQECTINLNEIRQTLPARIPSMMPSPLPRGRGPQGHHGRHTATREITRTMPASSANWRSTELNLDSPGSPTDVSAWELLAIAGLVQVTRLTHQFGVVRDSP